ncbi:MAG: phosphatase PAP2 family protein [Candidatus Aenigmatarchaeota archaeon]
MDLRSNQTLIKITLFLIPIILIGVCYKAIQYISPTGFYPALPLDAMIPYISYFVIPYILYFPYILLPFLLLWKRPKDYKQLALTYILILIISEVVYLTFQTAVVRPDIQPVNIFDQVVLMIYGADDPLNALPSLHTSLSIAAALFVWRFSKKLGIPAVILTILIILSTLFIRQHVILDVVAGTLLAFAAYYAIRRRYASHPKTRP